MIRLFWARLKESNCLVDLYQSIMGARFAEYESGTICSSDLHSVIARDMGISRHAAKVSSEKDAANSVDV